MPLQPNDVLGPYEVIGLIGEGGMGAVYRARDTRLGRDVAIKVLTSVAISDRERLVRFEQEARATGMLNHPNLLTVFDVGRDAAGNPFLVTELLEGEPLANRLTRGPLSPRRALDAALQMAQGLAAAHEKGIVHRDLKPDNIFLTRDGRLKILDFGIAKLTGGADDGPKFEVAATEPGIVLGTVGYMSPEQVRGELVDQRSDIFSFGAILFEMLTGARAFKRSSAIETLSAILREEPPDLAELLPNVPPPIERLVRRCLEKDRDLRFQNARDLAFNLETLAQMSSATTLSGVPRPSTAEPKRTVAPPASAPAATATATSAPTMRQPIPTRVTPRSQRRVSPVLLVLLYVVSVGAAAYGAWMWTRSEAQAEVEPHFSRLTFRRGEVRSARFSPDGDTIVYSAAWNGEAPEIFVVPRGATEARSLGLPDAEILAVSRSSELAVLLHRSRVTGLGTLARLPLAGGVPREVANDIVSADWSPDGSSLAVIRQKADGTVVEFPIGTSRYETPHFVRNVRVAPDGKRLAILEPSGGEFEVAIMEERAQPVTIARGWARGATDIAWSPDGSEIWISGAPDSRPPALYAIDVASGAVRLVSRLTGALRIFDLSARGETLLANATWRAALVWNQGSKKADPQQPAVTATTAPEAEAVAAEPPPPAPSVPAVPPTEVDASWLDWSILADLSRDGKTILFSETREGGGLRSGVYLRHADAPVPVHLGEGVADGLSPDGRWVLSHHGMKLVLVPTGVGQARELAIDGRFEIGAAWLADSRRAVVGGAIGQGGYRLFLLDTLDETATPISPENIWNGGTRAFALSPDETAVAGMNRDQTITIYPIDGGDARPVPGVIRGEIPIVWSADGGSLFVHDPHQVPAQVHRVDLATGAREPWRQFIPPDPAGVYKIAPVMITPDGDAWAYNAMRTMSDLYLVSGVK